MTSFGVTLLSGGLDSTTVTAYAKERVDNLTALTFNYGQTHSKEVECARRIAAMMDITHKLVDISFLSDIAWYSALTNPKQFPVPQSDTVAGHRLRHTHNICATTQHDIPIPFGRIP